ncbi:hypothetical protein D1007_43324 [Hordeum vulgare]|nr:hypothetical protein D1007_43324 [Hordeum vulgare]
MVPSGLFAPTPATEGRSSAAATVPVVSMPPQGALRALREGGDQAKCTKDCTKHYQHDTEMPPKGAGTTQSVAEQKRKWTIGDERHRDIKEKRKRGFASVKMIPTPRDAPAPGRGAGGSGGTTSQPSALLGCMGAALTKVMEYEAGLVVSGPMTQLEADTWIQNMENHFGSNLISRKYEVSHALQYFTKSAAIWWKMHPAIQGFGGAESWEEFKRTLLRSRLIQKCYDNPKKKTCACKICGEIGHTQEEHTDGCTHCEENHPAEECPSCQVTCFLCEGTTHYPAQCHIYPKVQEVVKQQKDAVKENPKKKILEEPVMDENIEDPDGQGLTRFFSNACYSCGEEGHYSQDCTKRSQEYLGNFPTEEVDLIHLK